VDTAGIDVNVVAESADPEGVRHLAHIAERLDLFELRATAEASRSGDPEVPDDALARARHGLALMLDFDDAPLPWGAMVDLARGFPSLPLILLGAGAARDRALPAVLDHTLNLLVATGSGDIAQLVDTFGPHRFVWTAGASEPTAPPPGLHESVLHGNARALAAGDYAGSHL
jgi:hypothetical protein